MDTLASHGSTVIALPPRVRRVRVSRRRALEAAGWRTWLTYHENHRRHPQPPPGWPRGPSLAPTPAELELGGEGLNFRYDRSVGLSRPK